MSIIILREVKKINDNLAYALLSFSCLKSRKSYISQISNEKNQAPFINAWLIIC